MSWRQTEVARRRASIGASGARAGELGAAIASQSETTDGLQAQVGGLGDDVHFEVRVNGQAVDPMGYL